MNGRFWLLNGGASFDPDVIAFMNAAGIPADGTIYYPSTAQQITGIGMWFALDVFVKGLKSANIWSKMKAIYPFLGGTATTHKFNLKNPADTNAAFRLAFSGGLTHSGTGILPNGVNGFANPNLTPSINLTPANFHISYYSRTNIVSNTIEMGCGDLNGFFSPHLRIRFGGDLARFISGSSSNYGMNSVSNSDSRGLFLGSILSTTDRRFYRNSSIISSNTTNINNDLFSGVMLICGYNSSTTGVVLGFPSNKETSLVSIGDGLTDPEAVSFYNLVQAFQTTLNRQV